MNVQDCIRAVAKHYGIGMKRITGGSHVAYDVHARHVAMWLSAQMFPRCSKRIAWDVGRRTPTTITYATRRIEARRAADPAFKQETDELLAKVRNI